MLYSGRYISSIYILHYRVILVDKEELSRSFTIQERIDIYTSKKARIHISFIVSLIYTPMSHTIHDYLDIIRWYANAHRTPIIDSTSRSYLESLIIKSKPKHVLEIWSAIGRSTMAIADLIGKWGGDLISCEISYPSYAMACYYQSMSKVCNYTIYFADYCKISPKYFARPLDFVFIDGQKSEYLDYYLHLTSSIITVRDIEQRIYIQKPLLADTYTLVFDDVIKFATKVQPLIDHLHKTKTPHEIVQTTQDDGVLVVWVGCEC